ncbi:hypothetical protein XM38_015000 [Halomicronema hongdechloris C2206]|uniref:Uncharacterized protein n=1 Tax=Halomicronema hongdechloris C2206 TaxID=1641165 RepID=A0A1Z3HJT2_9CYAN|nr:hypothetical protein XM38_015000 [Halomicronema hongdechloris C2206]
MTYSQDPHFLFLLLQMALEKRLINCYLVREYLRLLRLWLPALVAPII